jgi:hypothetical protein
MCPFKLGEVFLFLLRHWLIRFGIAWIKATTVRFRAMTITRSSCARKSEQLFYQKTQNEAIAIFL